MSVITKPESAASLPVSKTTIAEGSSSTPIAKSTVAEGSSSIPISKETVAEGPSSAPVSKTTLAEGSANIPVVKATAAAISAALPVSKTVIVSAGVPRPLMPLVGMNFSSGQYMQGGRPVLFDDLFTYSRASSATFWNRRLDRNGKWETFLDTDYVGNVTNLLTYSEQFDHVNWVKTNITVDTNAVQNYEGLNIAERITDDTVNGVHRTFQIVAGVTSGVKATFSIKAKADTHRYIALIDTWVGASASDTTIFDLQSGVIVSGSGSIHYVGNGWYEISKEYTTSATSVNPQITMATSSLVLYAGTGTSLYISEAQLTESAKPLPYVKTISAAVTETFVEALRLEYDPITAQAKGALIEGGVTNLFVSSEEFDNASWTKSSSIITANDAIAPDGTTSMDKMVADSTASIVPKINQSIVSVAAQQYTSSIEVKKGETSFMQIFFGTGHVANDPRVNFDIANGVIGSQDADIDNAAITELPNGIYRIEATVTAIGTSLQTQFVAALSDTVNRNTVQAWTINEGLYIFGAQCEPLNFASSYTRTEGSPVARAADNLSLPSVGNFNADEFTVVSSALFNLGDGNSEFVYSISDATSNNRVEARSSTTSNFNLVYVSGGTLYANAQTTSLPDGFNSSHVVFDGSNVQAYLNKTQDVSATALPIVSHTTINIGAGFDGVDNLYGHIKLLNIYEEAMTAQEVSLL